MTRGGAVLGAPTSSASRPAPWRRRSEVFAFTVSVLLLGAVTTIAVAWGCRWVTDERRSHRAGVYWSDVTAATKDAHGEWGSGKRWHAHVEGGDGRRFIRHHAAFGPKHDTLAIPRDVGVEWLTVQGPEFHGLVATGGTWIPDGAAVSRDPAAWRAPETSVVPWWSSLESQSLLDDGAVVEMGIGWPVPAFIVTHHLPRAPVPWHPLQRDTRGAWYGTVFGGDTLVQLPWRPHGIGFTLNLMFWSAGWMVILVVILFGPSRGRAAWRRWRSRCMACGYRQHDVSAGACAECGADGWSWHPPWRAARSLALSIVLLLGAAEFVYAMSIRTHPEVSPVLRAAYDGDPDRLHALMADPMDWHVAAFDVGLDIARRLRGGVNPVSWMSRPSPPYSAFLAAAALGGEFETFRSILEAHGVETEPVDGVMALETFDAIQLARAFGSTAFVTALHDAMGWTVEMPAASPRAHAPALLEPVYPPFPACRLEVAINRMQHDSTFHRDGWDSAVQRACIEQDLEACHALAALGPPNGRADDLPPFGITVLQLFELGALSSSEPMVPVRRTLPGAAHVAAAHALIDSVRGTAAVHSVALPEVAMRAMAIENQRAHDLAIEVLTGVTLPTPRPSKRPCTIWHVALSGPSAPIPVERIKSDWRSLSAITTTIGLNAACDERGLTVLEIAVATAELMDRIPMLVELGADVTDVAYDRATPAMRDVLTNALLEFTQPVHRRLEIPRGLHGAEDR